MVVTLPLPGLTLLLSQVSLAVPMDKRLSAISSVHAVTSASSLCISSHFLSTSTREHLELHIWAPVSRFVAQFTQWPESHRSRVNINSSRDRLNNTRGGRSKANQENAPEDKLCPTLQLILA
ncbi:hypothetical protein CFAM422_013128 [Trichoderma lentiforme]|uniref:Secreted protein n=1 Tax=Trichoderma lentiforme TaxID=1567552 RepID=A0A9P4X175_9HYPO|nr:hypothetical protein CFAM422_013128 [Trichoderma lentiforme]